MRYLILGLFLTGCSTSYKPGECIQFYQTYKYKEQSGLLGSGEPVYSAELIEDGNLKVSCPVKEKKFLLERR